MKPNFIKIGIISFNRKTNVLSYQYRLGNSFILRTYCTKDLGIRILIGNFIFSIMSILFFSHALKLLLLIRKILIFFSTLDGQLMLYFSLVRSKLEYASVDWNSFTITDSNKLESVQRKFAFLCHNRFFQDVVSHIII
jgi:hypothetical protein